MTGSKISASIVSLLVALLLASCDSNQVEKRSSDVPAKLTGNPLIDNLPPDPGDAGKATLEGIDSDGDGVRDDVQRWIAINFSNSEKTRAALTQDAKAMQQFLLDAANSAKSLNNALLMSGSISCLTYVQQKNFYGIATEHKAKMLNTYERSKAWIQADGHLSGHMFADIADEKSSCDFNPDLMAN